MVNSKNTAKTISYEKILESESVRLKEKINSKHNDGNMSTLKLYLARSETASKILKRENDKNG